MKVILLLSLLIAFNCITMRNLFAIKKIYIKQNDTETDKIMVFQNQMIQAIQQLIQMMMMKKKNKKKLSLKLSHQSYGENNL